MDADSNSYQSARMNSRMPNKLIIKYAWISICFSTVVIFAAILLQILVLVNIFPLMEFCLILLFAAVLLYVCTAFITLLIISKVKPERQHNRINAETFAEYENIRCTQRMIEQIPPLSTSHLDNYQPSTLIPTPPPPYVESAGERTELWTYRSRDKVVRRQRSRLKQVHRRPNNEHRRRDLHDQVQILNRQVSARNSGNSAGIEMTTINTSQNTRKICRNSRKEGERWEEIPVSSESETRPRSKLHQISSRCRARKKGINASSESERARMMTLHQKSPGPKEDIDGSSLFEQKFEKSTCRNSHRHLAKKDDVSPSSKSERRLIPNVISSPKQKESNYANVNDVSGISPTNLNTIPYKCQKLDSREADNIEEENLMPSVGRMEVSAFTGGERLGAIDDLQLRPSAQSRTLKAGSARLPISSRARKAHVDIKSPNRASLLSKSRRISISDASRLFSNHQSSHTTSNRISSPSKFPSALNSKTYNMSPNKQTTYNEVIVPTKFPSVDNSKESMVSPNKKAACLAPRETSFSENTPMASVSNKSRFSSNPEIPNSTGILEQGHASSSKDLMGEDKTMVCGQSGCTQTQINSKAKERQSLRSMSDISKKEEAVGQITQRICSLQDPENLSHMARPDSANRLVTFDFGVFSTTNNALWNEASTNKVTDLL